MMEVIKRALGKWNRRSSYILEYMKYMVLFPIASLIYKNRKIYLISERGDEARDNAYHLFKYYREYHPDLEVYYVIGKTSPDRNKVKKYGNIVDYRSLKHYLLFIAAEYKISTHLMGFSTNRLFYQFYYKKLPIKGKFIFLQHGVIKDDLPGLYREVTDVSIFICGAKPEYEYVNSSFHYKNGEVRYTGLARFDALHDFHVKKQILVMPTWRVYLKNSTAQEFETSDYFKAWNNALCDKELLRLLEEEDIQLVFYPHYEMQKYVHLFRSESRHILIASAEQYDVQTLLKESALLVTDFSSVFFDFAYMGKPCIYYQFDISDFRNAHYSDGYFEYERDGFGKVCCTSDQLLSEIRKCVNCEFRPDEIYLNRCSSFFELRDNHNCERIYQEIESL